MPGTITDTPRSTLPLGTDAPALFVSYFERVPPPTPKTTPATPLPMKPPLRDMPTSPNKSWVKSVPTDAPMISYAWLNRFRTLPNGTITPRPAKPFTLLLMNRRESFPSLLNFTHLAIAITTNEVALGFRPAREFAHRAFVVAFPPLVLWTVPII